jgi:hypothetical protein
MEGFEAWEVLLRCSGQFKLYPSGKIAGFDIPTILSVTDVLGYDRQALLRLLGYAEAGLHEAIRDHGNSNAEHFDQDSGR